MTPFAAGAAIRPRRSHELAIVFARCLWLWHRSCCSVVPNKLHQHKKETNDKIAAPDSKMVWIRSAGGGTRFISRVAAVAAPPTLGVTSCMAGTPAAPVAFRTQLIREASA
jgi:hypothetical protein